MRASSWTIVVMGNGGPTLGTQYVPYEYIFEYCVRVLMTAGVDERDASTVSKHLVDADLAGKHSHGVALLPIYVENTLSGQIDVGAKPLVSHEGGSWTVVDGNRCFGQISADFTRRVLCDKVAELGFVVGFINSCGHVGRLGGFVREIALEGFGGLMTVASAFKKTEAIVAPHGSRAAVLGTNPLALAVPGENGPVVIDFATSTGTYFGLSREARVGPEKEKFEGLDSQGNPTNLAAEVLNGGALLTIGGHRGTALSLMLSLLCGLSGDIDPLKGEIGGACMFVFDIDQIVNANAYKRSIDELGKIVRNSDGRPGFYAPVAFPGDFSSEKEFRQIQSGIRITPDIRSDLERAASLTGCDVDIAW